MSRESITSAINYEETELTLGLPGESRGTKRAFSEETMSGESVSKKSKKDSAVVGWPPVKEHRKIVMRSCKYVKVAVDGTPFLRKVDLQSYGSYDELLRALQDLFGCFVVRDLVDEKKLVDVFNGKVEYVPTYEDRDGDWMLLGDVPWKMFSQSCKRLRLMTGTLYIGSSSSC
ncbi:auxin-responsive protein IAA1 [Daucus carota subsp. sativus]|uniref:Auxin-responsive protein n=1 Tax=Daucus carota subsp. sativus TaxID=79200 RepID=A0A164XCA1_DAUCS|nr:PREDICTED: auxin-responsive protein IAA1-like [Daucus carota subsp. sativus]